MKLNKVEPSTTQVVSTGSQGRPRAVGSLGVALMFSGLMGLGVLGGCKSDDGVTNKPIAAAERPRRAGIAFVRCMETSGGGCVEMSDQMGAWDAFSVLGWLASGSPMGILQRLPSELAIHSDRKQVLRRFTSAAGRLQRPLRGAECSANSAQPLEPMIPQLEKAATARLQKIGIWNDDLAVVVAGLAKESQGLSGGYLVEMSCQADPYSFYVATAVEGERHLAVGLLSGLPEFLGGNAPSREVVERKLQSQTLGDGMTVGDSSDIHPWVRVPPEVF